jgi:hypothetical protein
VVDDNQVDPSIDRPGEERPRSGHSGHDPLHITRTLDLQPIGAVVPHGVGIQDFIEISYELEEVHVVMVPQPALLTAPRSKAKTGNERPFRLK